MSVVVLVVLAALLGASHGLAIRPNKTVPGLPFQTFQITPMDGTPHTRPLPPFDLRGESACEVCRFIRNKVEHLSSDERLASTPCSGLTGFVKTACQGFLETNKDVVLLEGCDKFCLQTAEEDDPNVVHIVNEDSSESSSRARRDVINVDTIRICTQHTDCFSSEYCDIGKVCRACSQCSLLGTNSSIDGYCPCLGGKISVTAPGASASWFTGQEYSITWTAENAGRYFNIYVYKKDGTFFGTVKLNAEVDSTGKGTFRYPVQFTWAFDPTRTSGEYYIQIVSVMTLSVTATSPSFFVYKGTSCKSHDVCSSTNYCDLWGDCYDCRACDYYKDAYDGKCPYKCLRLSAWVSISRPTNRSAAATGSYLPINWDFNAGVGDKINLYLLQGSKTVYEIALEYPTSKKSLVWLVPRTFPSGTYYIAVTHPNEFTVIGIAPAPLRTMGDQTFQIIKTLCTSHDNCLSTEYCDKTGLCYPCSSCLREFDAIDDVCPVKCGGGTELRVGQSLPNTTEAAASGVLQDYVLPGCNSYSDLVVRTPNSCLVFANSTSTSEPARMSKRLSQKLDSLCDILRNAYGDKAQILVSKGYEAPPSNPALGSLHNAGRAAVLSVLGTSTLTAAQLGVLASRADFDWVFRPNTDSIYVSVIRDQCRQNLDLIFVLDGSGSVELEYYGGSVGTFQNKVLKFVESVVNYFDIGANLTRVGVVTFSSNVTINFNLNSFTDKTSLINAVRSIPYPQGATYTNLALRAVRTSMLTEANGMRPSNAGIPRVVVLITDGQANPGYEPAAEAALLRNMNVNIFTIGVGASIGVDELKSVASSPIDTHVLILKSFNNIANLVDTMSAITCTEPAVIQAGTAIDTVVQPCESAYFNPLCGVFTNVIIEVRTLSGQVAVYVSRSEPNPSAVRFDFKDESSSSFKSIRITRNSTDTAPTYVAVRGVGSQPARFVLNVWSDIFSSINTGTVLNFDELTPVGTVIFTPPPVSLGSATPSFDYRLEEGGEDGRFSVESSTGIIRVARPLDRETRANYKLRVSARERNFPCLTGVADVLVSVTDVNDNPPIFTSNEYAVRVLENIPAGTAIQTVLALDADEGLNALVTYSIEDRTVPFRVHPSSGVISTTSALDAETVASYQFFVVASDQGTPSLSTRVIVRVTVLPVACDVGTFSATGTFPCSPCPQNTFQDGRSTPKACTPCGCPANTFATSQCTATRNSDCSPCPAFSTSPAQSNRMLDCTCTSGFYNSLGVSTGEVICKPCTASCPSGSFLLGNCTPTATPECRVCTTLSSCGPDSYLSGSCSGRNDFSCAKCSVCPAGQFVRSPCTELSDRTCAPCRTIRDCPAGFRIDSLCSGNNTLQNPTCVECVTKCAAGQFLTGTCGGADGLEATRCVQCRDCVAGEYEVSPCTASSDRVCRKCITSCPAGQYIVGACAVDQPPPLCRNCTTAADCAAGFYLEGTICGDRTSPTCQPCHDTCATCAGRSDSQCLSCRNGLNLLSGRCVSACGVGLYGSNGQCNKCHPTCLDCFGGLQNQCTSCPRGTALMNGACVATCDASFFNDNGFCKKCRVCPEPSYKVGGCSDSQDTVCEPWSPPCILGVEYEAQSPTAFVDRKCIKCTTSCPAGQELYGACTTEDRVCQPCAAGMYKDTIGSGSCKQCTTRCDSSQFITGVCTATENRVCNPCPTSCDPGFYLKGICDGTDKRPTCRPCSICANGTYEIASCSSANGGSDTSCSACLTSCPAGQYLTGVCGGRQNTQCSVCLTPSDCLPNQILMGVCGGLDPRSSPKCVDCHPTCATCTGPGVDQCKTCSRGLQLDGTLCVDSCGKGRFANPLTQRCEDCHPDCVECQLYDTCLACKDNLFLLESKCLPSCPLGMYGDKSSWVCKKCSDCPLGQFRSGGCDGRVDSVCTPWTVCPDGQYEIEAPSALKDRVCRDCIKECPPGEQLTGQCKDRNFPTCSACPTNTYKAVTGADKCQPCVSSCQDGFYLTGSCTAQSSPKCTACTTECPANQRLVGVCGGRSNYACEACSSCKDGEYEIKACTSAQNRECAACRTSCSAGEYLVGACGGPNGNSNPFCEPCTTVSSCKANEYLSGSCGGTDPRSNPVCKVCHPTCAACKGDGESSCTKCPPTLHLTVDGRCVSDCGDGFYNDDSKGVCQPCDSSCGDCTGPSPNFCTSCRANATTVLFDFTCLPVCPDGYYEDSNRVCQRCSTCQDGTYKTGGCSGKANTQCTPWTVCPQGTFASTQPTAFQDRKCSACKSSCPAGFQLNGVCTGSSDFECAPCPIDTFKAQEGSGKCQPCVSSCASGFFLVGECSATSTPVCTPCTRGCDANSYLVGVCGGRSNPTCTACTVCDVDEFETVACTLRSNRQCAKCTTASNCAVGQFLEGKCTATSNPVCKPCTTAAECSPGEFLDGTCAPDLPNPVCRTCTPCKPNEYQVRECTKDHDRVCKPCISECPSGSFLTGSCPGPIQDVFHQTVVVGDITYAALDGADPFGTTVGCQSAGLRLPSGWQVAEDNEASRRAISTLPWSTKCMAVASGRAYLTSTVGKDAGGVCTDCGTNCLSLSSLDNTYSVTGCLRRILVVRKPTQCLPCTSECSPGEYLSGTCSGRENTVCKPCTLCQDGEYETVPCTRLPSGTTNRECAPCRKPESCASGQYLAGTCGGASNPTCEPCVDSCPADFYLQGVCGGLTNPSCQRCKACRAGVEFESAPCGGSDGHKDRVCLACTTAADCSGRQYLAGVCTLSSNPVCRPCTEPSACKSSEYFDDTCGGSTDSSCKPCHPSCKSCVAGSPDSCLTCNGALVLQPLTITLRGDPVGTCVSDCPAGQVKDSGVCKPCASSCKSCALPNNPSACTNCTGSLYLTPSGTCSSSCPAGFFGSDNVCVKCSACAPGQYAASGCVGTTNTVCKPLTLCKVGEKETVAPTATSDRSCQACDGVNFYQDKPESVDCLVVRTCDPLNEFQVAAPTASSDRICRTLTVCDRLTQFELRARTATSDRVCRDLTVCSAFQWEAQIPTLTSDRGCRNFTTCIRGVEFESVAPSETSDRVCQKLSTCTASEYEAVAPTDKSDRVCRAITVCSVSEYETAAPTRTSDRTCQPLSPLCASGKYEAVPPTKTSDRVCKDLKICLRTEFQSVAPTYSTDRVCAPYTECKADSYESTAPTATTDRKCTPLTRCSSTQYIALPHTLTSDRLCANCSVCPAGKFETLACQADQDTQCAGCTPCLATEFQVAACTATKNSVCSPCKLCSSGEFVSQACSQAADTVCTPCSKCGANQFELRACTATTNTDCRAVTRCVEELEFQASAPTATSDRVCKPFTVCDEKEFIAVLGTPTSDRQCKLLTTCSSLEFEAVAPTNTSNRVCRPLTVCDDVRQFVSQRETLTSDRVCSLLTVCLAGQEVQTPATKFSDRVCRPCPRGFLDDDSDGTTPCVMAPPGTFVSEGQFGSPEQFQCKPGTADLDSRADTPCQACDGTTQFQNLAGQIECKRVSSCSAGSEQLVAPTPFSDRLCRSCQLGLTFKAASDPSAPCTNVTSCPAGQQESLPPTTSSDRECKQCSAGTFKASPGEGTVCVVVSQCASGQQEKVAPTPSTDRVCEPCPAGTFKSTVGQDVCKPFTVCTSSQYEIRAPRADTDRACAPLTVCKAGEFQSKAPTATSDRVCDKCSTCPAGQTQLNACTSTSDTRCQNCPQCVSGESYVKVPCSSTEPTLCAQCSTCGKNQFVARACSLFLDTICANVTVCDPTFQFTKVEATSTSDRVCAPLTVCKEDEYESKPKTSTSDRVCSRLTVCSAGSEIATPHTATSDRVCRLCPAGTTDSDTNGLTPCTPCSAGQYSGEGSMGPCVQCDPGTADDDKNPATPCSPCQEGISYQSSKGAVACLLVEQCPPGQTELEAPTTTRNRVCQPCASGFFKPDAGQTPCLPHTVCTKTQYLDDQGTAITDNICRDLTVCDPSTMYERKPATPVNDRQCGMLTVCSELEYELVPKSLTSDRVCAALTICVPGQYESVPPTATSNRVCRAVSSCADGEYQVSAPTNTSDRVCAKWSVCPPESYEVQAPSILRDRVCKPWTKCGSNEYEVVSPTALRNRVCDTCDVCPSTHFTVQACTPTSNTVCSGCGSCSANQYISSPCQPNANVVCSTCDTCLSGVTFAKSACTRTANTVCQSCSTCNSATHYISALCTPTSDTVCTPITPRCDEDKYESAPPTLFEDRQCTPLTLCKVSEYESKPAGTYNNRECKPLTVCTNTQYEAIAPTATSDRQCKALTVCRNGQFESVAPTATTDRVCSSVKECGSGFYEAAPPSGFSDRVCLPLTTCDPALQYESVPPTATSDRQCARQPLLGLLPQPSFSVRGAGFKIGEPSQAGVQEIGQTGGDDPASVGKVTASLGSLGAFSSFAVDKKPASVVSMVPLMDTRVYAEKAIVSLGFQVWDASFNSQTLPATVSVVISGKGRSDLSVSATCATAAASGICIASLRLPSQWFGVVSAATIRFGLQGVQASFATSTTELTLMSQAPTAISNDVAFVMPSYPLFPGDVVDVAVLANTGAFAVAAFTIAFQSTADLEIVAVNPADSSKWRAMTQTQSKTSAAITAQLDDVASAASGAAVSTEQVATVTLRVMPAAVAGTQGTLTGRVHFLSSIASRVQPRNETFPALREGKVLFGSTSYTGLLAYSFHGELFNTALLGGSRVSTGIKVMAGTTAGGFVDVTSMASCTSPSASVLKVRSDCSSVFLDGTEDIRTPGSEKIEIVINVQNGPSTRVPFRVWTPTLPLTLRASDTTLNKVRGWLDFGNLCRPGYQSSEIFAYATMASGTAKITDLDVSHLIIPTLQSSDTSVASLAPHVLSSGEIVGAIITGRQPGQVVVNATLNGNVLGQLSFTVSEQDVAVTRLDAIAVASISIIAPNTVGASALATASVDRTLTARNQRAPVYVSAVTSDGQRMEVMESMGLNLQVTSAGQGVVATQGSSVVALKSGSGDLVTAQWNSPGCVVGSIAQSSVKVDVRLPGLVRLEVSTSGALAACGDASSRSPISTPTSSLVSVTAFFQDGSSVDVSSDPLLGVSAAGLILAQSSSGLVAFPDGPSCAQNVSNRVTFNIDAPTRPQADIAVLRVKLDALTAEANVRIVSVSRLSLRASPFPKYENSASVSRNTLRRYPSPSFSAQRALVTPLAILSDGRSVDLTSASVDMRLVDVGGTTPSVAFFSLAKSAGTDTVVSRLSSNLGNADVLGTWEGLTARVTISGSNEILAVTNVSVSLPTTVRGLRGVMVLPSVTLTLSDGSLFPNFVNQQGSVEIAGILDFTQSVSSATTVSRDSGAITLLANARDLTTLTASVVGSSVRGSALFAANLDPDVGDVDLGDVAGLPIPRVTTSTFAVPVRANVGSVNLGSLQLRIAFDPARVALLDVSQGADFPGGSFEFDMSVPGQVRITLSPKGQVRGLATLAVLSFRTIAASCDLCVFTTTIVEFSDGNGRQVNSAFVLPATSFTGTVPYAVQVSSAPPARRRRASEDNVCLAPPCAICGGVRELGDTNFDCVFDLLDVNFVQAYILQTIYDPLYPTTLLRDQRTAADADGNGIVDNADSDLLLRVIRKYTRFVTGLTAVPVSRLSGCRMAINVTCLQKGNAPADGANTMVHFDLESNIPTFNQLLQSSVVEVGSVVTLNKGNGLRGAILRASYLGGGVFGVVIRSAIDISAEIGISVVVSTPTVPGLSINTDALTVARFGTPFAPYTFGRLDASFTTFNNTPARIFAPQGYNPAASIVSGTSSAACHAQSSCNATTEYTIAPATATSDIVCGRYTVCDFTTQYERTRPTSTSNRVCSSLTNCDLTTQFIFSQPTTTSDRVCKVLTTCTSSQFELRPPTATSDRECSRLRDLCPVGFYEAKAPTPTSDRVCAIVRTCGSGEVEIAPPTATSDRICQKMDYCVSSPCGNRGTCVNAADGFVCLCKSGYSGQLCNVRDLCALIDNPCVNDGVCVSSSDGVMCDCSNSGDFGGICCKQFFGDQETMQICKTAAEIEASTKNGGSGSSNQEAGVIAGAVFAGIALFVVLVVGAVVYFRRRRQKNLEQVSDMQLLESSFEGMANPLYNTPDHVYPSFARCVAFDHMRYNRPLLSLTNTDLGKVYDLLRIPRPSLTVIPALRYQCLGFMQKPVTSKLVGETGLRIEEVLTFVEAAFADALMESFIDMIVAEQLGEDSEAAYEPVYAAIDDDIYGLPSLPWNHDADPRLAGSDYEELSEAFTMRRSKRAPSVAADERMDVGPQPRRLSRQLSEEPFMISVNGEPIYTLGSTPSAGAPTYDMASGKAMSEDQEPLYTTATLKDGGRQISRNDAEPMYHLGTGVDDEPMYSFANRHPSTNSTLLRRAPTYTTANQKEPTYVMASGGNSSVTNEPMYSLASSNTRESFVNEAIYNFADNDRDRLDSLPPVGSRPMVSRRNTVFEDEIAYDFASAVKEEGEGVTAEPMYTLASDTPDSPPPPIPKRDRHIDSSQNTGLGLAEGEDEPTYDNSAPLAGQSVPKMRRAENTYVMASSHSAHEEDV